MILEVDQTSINNCNFCSINYSTEITLDCTDNDNSIDMRPSHFNIKNFSGDAAYSKQAKHPHLVFREP